MEISRENWTSVRIGVVPLNTRISLIKNKIQEVGRDRQSSMIIFPHSLVRSVVDFGRNLPSETKTYMEAGSVLEALQV